MSDIRKNRILVVEDEQIIAFNLKSRLEKLGYEVPAFVATGEEAIAAVGELNPDLVLMDIMLEGDMDGVETASIINSRYNTPFLYLTASSDEATVQRAKKTNPLGYLIKPFDENLLRITLEMALYKHDAETRIQNAEKRLTKINDCFLGFGVNPLENINSLVRLCGELLHADLAVYCSWRAPETPEQQALWSGGEVGNYAHHDDCILCSDIRSGGSDTVSLYDAAEYRNTCLLKRTPGISPEGVFYGIPVREGNRDIGTMAVYFGRKQEKSDETDRVMGINASAIRIEESRQEAEHVRQKLQDQLIQSQKLEAIGTMAGGVAHEINNPLMGIINYAQLIVDRLPEESGRLMEFSREIIKEGERIADIVRDLLAFSRKEREGMSTNTVMTIVNGALSFAGRMLEKDEIRVDIRVDDSLPLILCKEQQIEQVLLNLLTNARDAINNRYPGYHENKTITIDAETRMVSGRKMVRINVRDTGEGVPEEVAHKLFDPFFSTKPKHKGTGLGLAVSYGIVKEHSGQISFTSKAGEGTEFHLDLPAAPVS